MDFHRSDCTQHWYTRTVPTCGICPGSLPFTTCFWNRRLCGINPAVHWKTLVDKDLGKFSWLKRTGEWKRTYATHCTDVTYDQVDWFSDKGKSYASEAWPGHSPVSLWALSYLATGCVSTSLTLDLVSNFVAVKSLISSFSILSDDRFKASSKTIPPHSTI